MIETLKPLPQSKLSCLVPIIEHRIKESNLSERATLEEEMVKLERGYNARLMAAFVDNFEEPKVALIMSNFPSTVTDGNYAYCLLYYVVPELRGKSEYGKLLITTAEAYGRFHRCDYLIMTSWIYKGAKGTDAFLKRYGFEPQEVSHVKKL